MLKSIDKHKKIILGILFTIILIAIMVISYFMLLATTPTYNVTVCRSRGTSACSRQQTVTIIRGTENIEPVFEVGYECPNATYPVFDRDYNYSKFIGCTNDTAFKPLPCDAIPAKFVCLGEN
jgi:hypothetical protein